MVSVKRIADLLYDENLTPYFLQQVPMPCQCLLPSPSNEIRMSLTSLMMPLCSSTFSPSIVPVFDILVLSFLTIWIFTWLFLTIGLFCRCHFFSNRHLQRITRHSTFYSKLSPPCPTLHTSEPWPLSNVTSIDLLNKVVWLSWVIFGDAWSTKMILFGFILLFASFLVSTMQFFYR